MIDWSQDVFRTSNKSSAFTFLVGESASSPSAFSILITPILCLAKLPQPPEEATRLIPAALPSTETVKQYVAHDFRLLRIDIERPALSAR
ncbi:MAG: hypothetical protein CMO80_12535 [Verrucomicrobiales bacterium]|nr:hypothetical protein [Verrucomicrobiales bacterium]